MSGLQLIGHWVVGPETHRIGITDMIVATIGGQGTLFTTTGRGGGVMSLQFDTGGTSLVLRDQVSFSDTVALGGPGRLVLATVGGQVHLLTPGPEQAAGLKSYVVAGNGSLGSGTDWVGSGISGITDIAFTAGEGRAVNVNWLGTQIGLNTVSAAPALTRTQNAGTVASPARAEISALEIAQSGANEYALALASSGDLLKSLQISNNSLILRDSLGPETGLAINGGTALATARMGGETWVFAAGANSSSISVMRLETDGRLTLTDHVVDNLYTRFQGVQSLAAVEMSGRVFLAAGGGDDGVSLMQLMPDGRLTHVDSVADAVNRGLDNVSAVAGTQVGGDVAIFAASAREAGITRLGHDPGPLAAPIRGTTAANTLTGGSQNDLIFGDGGADRLTGGAGDDILVDGAGSDTLTGDAGADLFVLSSDGAADRITDFEPGQDRLDLTGFGRVYDVSALSVSTVAGGAIIRFGTEELQLYTSDGQSLQRSDFQSSELFELTHVMVVDLTRPSDPEDHTGPDPLGAPTVAGSAGANLLNGTGAEDHIYGEGGNDTLRGQGGNDILTGGPGGDRLEGGAGRDTVSYFGSVGSLRVDLLFPQVNTNIAQGDSYSEIENLFGSQGFDNLRGTFEDNQIFGWRNVDYIFGRRGDDTLEGGIGDDVLFGGPGADVLRGGENRDRAQYSESLTGLVLDLQYPGRNTGEAVGDQYDSIEDLAGGRYDDEIWGNTGDNRLFGREGHDTLNGRLGDDYLNGGAMRDTLIGGPGDDTLRGGQNFHTFVYDGGRDVIEDYVADFDSLRIDNLAYGNAYLSVNEVLDFARVVGGNTVFSFTPQNTLTLIGVTDIGGLSNDITLI